MTRYRYIIYEADGDGEQHELTGEVNADSIQSAVNKAMAESFVKLTGGNAEFGKPGKGGCRGPYTILQLTLHNEDA